MNLVLASIHIDNSLRAVSLGTAMLAATVEQQLGDQVVSTLVDCTLEQSAASCTEQILIHQPDIVGLSLTVWNRDLALDIAGRLKTARPRLILLAGGPEVTADPDTLNRNGLFNLIMTGEGEHKIVAALQELLRGQAPCAGSLLAAEPIDDLGELPSPYLTGLLRPSPGAGALWELSRGCPYRCDFCFESRGSAVVRRFPLERVRAELQLFAALGLCEVFVLDPTFNYHQPTAKELLRIMAEEGQGLHFSLEIRAERVDRELAELFAAINCSLQIGLQSADPSVLRDINRDFDPEEFSDKVLLLHEAGVCYGFDLIYGLPGDSLEGFLASFDYALSLIPNHLDIFPLAVLPGTRLADKAGERGLDYQKQPPYQVRSSATFSAADMQQAARIATACDLFYNRGRAVPWFAMVLNSLEWSPSEFFLQLIETLPAALQADPLPLQKHFISAQFEKRRQPQVAALCCDLLNYFGLVEPLFDSPPLEPQPTRATREFAVNPHSCLIFFQHEPQLLLQHLAEGVTDLEELAFFIPVVNRHYFCCLYQDDLQLYPLDPEQCDYLKSLTTSAPAAAPSADFIQQALEAGILFRCG